MDSMESRTIFVYEKSRQISTAFEARRESDKKWKDWVQFAHSWSWPYWIVPCSMEKTELISVEKLKVPVFWGSRLVMSKNEYLQPDVYASKTGKALQDIRFRRGDMTLNPSVPLIDNFTETRVVVDVSGFRIPNPFIDPNSISAWISSELHSLFESCSYISTPESVVLTRAQAILRWTDDPEEALLVSKPRNH
jgi:hypothetical protein